MCSSIRLALSVVLLLGAVPAYAAPVLFTYEGRISRSYIGLLAAIGVDASERVSFSFLVGDSDPGRTLGYAEQRDVLGSLLTIGDYWLAGGAGRTQVFNGPIASVDYDQFTAYSYSIARAFRFGDRYLRPRLVGLTLNGNAQVLDSGIYPSIAPDPTAFATQELSVSYYWVDDPSRGVAFARATPS
jgi:hypothetical protein